MLMTGVLVADSNPRQKGPCISQCGVTGHCATDAPAALGLLFLSVLLAVVSIGTVGSPGPLSGLKSTNTCTDNFGHEKPDILQDFGLAEVRWTGAGSMKLGSKTLNYSGGLTHERGVGMLFDVTTAKTMENWCLISDRVVVAKLVAKQLHLGMIQVYAPTPHLTVKMMK
ncbi:endonuclease exonuclease phosphatase domain containing protein [Plakobranchus ocellatus]|uniref:Endonuclease exonuclease phosphatase domain containing protein n=1 Tax=Plakobranchus ocellatus TaxID=259542 RepID=A0AAV3ZG42_9GAST|nr:endonuclease exonuclease phosphatase domain containing protein [Plakobranchus ocellatus]